MINLDALKEQCPECSGLGKTVNPDWYPLWAAHSNCINAFEVLNGHGLVDVKDTTTLEELDEPIFFVCKECKGRGQILTPLGRSIVEQLLDS
ncbi:hypothetical protein Desaci_3590 [Desulfosporosinus acidiphilus SJ4]|uniref:Uncharacterized protein n=1 Tax=Desulfosporosinus acidiphilus (strain DSM 22704 / JCM 16185 / SJ4) TaxID=646529 RepID=I4D9J7_DESAJ|nr:hypothetical protein [Desulfosporosinus acidiphilus]AFM42471.1 hypothetical protein Desaci_3590 [Desulfosporosinus acidiphilus SJ4]